jgi:hypothetical protein
VIADLIEQRRCVLLAQSMACGMIHLFVPRLGIDGEQLVDQFHRADGRGILFIEFDRIHEVPPGVCLIQSSE